ncbi:MAG TPA: SGNH/GDSL hydrolase family protein [Polyangiaceae bacterium]|nr:SGNH/GDSL hydrolase family protein [Polyangiaceae bacterium]
MPKSLFLSTALLSALACAGLACNSGRGSTGTASGPTANAAAGSSSGAGSPGSSGSPAGSGSGASASSGGSGSAPPTGGAGSDAGGSQPAGSDAGTVGDSGHADAAGAATGPADAGLPKIPGTITIMPIGDSITRATCWRAQLWQTLSANFPSRFHLVGTLNSDPGCGVTGYDTANQGYSSSLVTEVVAGVTTARTCDPFCPSLSDLQTAFDSVKPSVALIHYGTNDVWNGKAPSEILSAYSAVIDALRAANPAIVVLLAQIIPMNVTATTCAGCSCPACPTAVPALNAQIAAWAPTKTTAASPIVVVDQYTGFDAVADTADGVHPNATTGSRKMAAKWYAALAPLF